MQLKTPSVSQSEPNKTALTQVGISKGVLPARITNISHLCKARTQGDARVYTMTQLI
jgi:hypothetical protein